MLTSPLLEVRTSKPTSVTLVPSRSRFSARSSTVFPVAGRTSIEPLKFRTVNCPPAGIVPRHVYTVSLRPTIWASATAETVPVNDRASRRVGRVDRIAITWVEGWDGLPRGATAETAPGLKQFQPARSTSALGQSRDSDPTGSAAQRQPAQKHPCGEARERYITGRQKHPLATT